MISPEYCRTMAAYNAWQNRSVVEALKTLPEEELSKDRKAFFGSIFETANHLLWGDQLWIARFDGGNGPAKPDSEHLQLHLTVEQWQSDRMATDVRIERWAEGLDQPSLEADLPWRSTSTGKDMKMPLATCIIHFFNHQTHHRGQLHAMFTAAGLKTDVTDLVFMPE